MKELDPVFAEALIEDFNYVYDNNVTKELLKLLTDARMKAMALGDLSEAERNQMIGYAHGVAASIEVVHTTMQMLMQDELD